MDQFSHDLTVALEETSLLDRARVSRWGQQRRRTRSTGNLPCAPQPTEDSSSPTDIAQGPPPALASALNNDGLDAQNIHLPPSDSDEKDDGVDPPRLPCKLNSSVRLLGTLESDSLNETFSPARFFKPNARRKRKLKRATMDYEISGCDLAKSPPTMFNNIVHPTAFTASSLQTTNTSGISAMRKRCLKSDSTNRSQLFFCGKRKRSNREHDHSSSMPRHNMAAAAAAHHIIDDSYRMRPRSFSSTSKPHSDRLLPLNKGLLSKIERISQQQQKTDLASATTTTKLATIQTNLSATTLVDDDEEEEEDEAEEELLTDCALSAGNCEALSFAQITEENGILAGSGGGVGGVGAIAENTIEAAVCFANAASQATAGKSVEIQQNTGNASQLTLLAQQQQQQETTNFRNHRKNKSNSKSSNRHRLLQFTVDEHSMDCEELNDFTSSSLSSSDSEDERNARNDTDREGDDELTDWPGNESICGELKYDCKRKLTKRNTLPQIKSDPESLQMLEDDTVMTLTNNTGTAVPSLCSTPALVLSGSGGGGGGGGSSVELFNSNSTLNWPPAAAVAINNIAEKGNNKTTITSSPFSSSSTTTITTANATELSMPYQASEPINITVGKSIGFASFLHHHLPLTDDVNIPLTSKQIESEMSGETSTNPFLASPPCHANEVREIRAGCRRVKGDRPGFSIKTSVNERLARFLQDPRQLQIRLPDIEIYEHESLLNLATLYSLHYSLDNGCAVLNKTSNTTQSVNIDQHSLKSRLFLSDFKRRCYDNKKSAGLMPE